MRTGQSIAPESMHSRSGVTTCSQTRDEHALSEFFDLSLRQQASVRAAWRSKETHDSFSSWLSPEG